jgi:ParB/RepB/Spo0J family partition protein
MTETELEVEQWIPINEIQVPEERITSVHTPEILEEIYQSLEEQGQRDPIKCREVGGVLLLTDGLHRLMWARKQGLDKIRGVIAPGSMSDVLLDNWIFNRHRGQSDPVGEGLVLKTLMEEDGLSLRQAAEKCGTNKSTASRLVKIQSLDPYTLQHIRNGKLSVGSAFHITQLEAGPERDQVVEDAIKWGYTVQQTKDRVAFLLNPSHTPEPMEHSFQPTGEPEFIYPECFICDTELKHAEKIVRLCVGCFDVLEAKKILIPAPPIQEPPPEPIPFSHGHMQPPPPPVPPRPTQNIPQAPIPPNQDMAGCPHSYVVILNNGWAVCRDCGLRMGQVQQ